MTKAFIVSIGPDCRYSCVCLHTSVSLCLYANMNTCACDYVGVYRIMHTRKSVSESLGIYPLLLGQYGGRGSSLGAYRDDSLKCH